jgi:membrane protein required for colicin V production
MTGFDYAVGAVVGVSLLIGVLRGAVKELTALAGWVVAILVANRYATALAGQLQPNNASPTLTVVGAYVLIIIVCLLFTALLKLALSELIKAAGLTAVDRFLGIFVGGARGVLIVLLIVLAAGMTSLPQAPFWRDAALSSWFETLAIAVKPWLPQEIAQRIHFGELKV